MEDIYENDVISPLGICDNLNDINNYCDSNEFIKSFGRLMSEDTGTPNKCSGQQYLTVDNNRYGLVNYLPNNISDIEFFISNEEIINNFKSSSDIKRHERISKLNKYQIYEVDRKVMSLSIKEKSD